MNFRAIAKEYIVPYLAITLGTVIAAFALLFAEIKPVIKSEKTLY